MPRGERHQLYLVNGIRHETPEQGIVIDCVADGMARSLSEISPIAVVDHRPLATEEAGGDHAAANVGARNLFFMTESVRTAASTILRLQLTTGLENRVVWSDNLEFATTNVVSLSDLELQRRINDAVYAAINELLRIDRTAPSHQVAGTLCCNAIQRFFQLGNANLKLADELFDRAYQMDPSGVYLTWRAYLRTFRLAERLYSCRETLIEETLDFIARALESEPNNSFVRAVAAQVQLLMCRRYVTALEFAEESLRLNRSNPLAWALLGMSECHLGNPEQGFSHTLLGRRIAGSAPYRFHIDGMCCITATVAGKYEDAIRYGEICHADKRNYAPPHPLPVSGPLSPRRRAWNQTSPSPSCATAAIRRQVYAALPSSRHCRLRSAGCRCRLPVRHRIISQSTSACPQPQGASPRLPRTAPHPILLASINPKYGIEHRCLTTNCTTSPSPRRPNRFAIATFRRSS